jgi:hypothetical protein
MEEDLIATSDAEAASRDVPPAASVRRTLIRQTLSVFAAIVVLTVHVQYGSKLRPWFARVLESKIPKTVVSPPIAADAVEDEPSIVSTTPEPPPTKPAAPPPLDRAKIAKAEAALDAASRDRARSESRAGEAARMFKEASQRSALEASLSKTLAFRVRDPSAQISRTVARGGFIRAQRDQVEKEIVALRSAPRAKATSIISRTPVSKVARNEEFHFELRHDRVSYINLTQLLNMCKSDAQVRLRLSDRVGVISSKVGPVGDFSLLYVLSRAVDGADDLFDRRSMRYDLRGWELVPSGEMRGETFEAAQNPISQFSRAIGRISPGSATITLWVYPDSFGLYRQLRDGLAAHGYTVAARPLPDGMSIRGSPMGSLSAAQ